MARQAGGSCAVCAEVGDLEDNNILMGCIVCKVVVHCLCYGIPFDEEQNSWTCSSCKSGADNVSCILCPSKQGAFKPATVGGFVHVVCALYYERCSFEDTDTMEPVAVVLPRKKKQKHCELCTDEDDSTVGVTIKCRHKRCQYFMHITCAQKHNLLVETLDKDNLICYEVYCKNHVESLKRLSSCNIKAGLKKNTLQNKLKRKEAMASNSSWILQQNNPDKLEGSAEEENTSLLTPKKLNFSSSSSSQATDNENSSVPSTPTTPSTPSSVHIIKETATLRSSPQLPKPLLRSSSREFAEVISSKGDSRSITPLNEAMVGVQGSNDISFINQTLSASSKVKSNAQKKLFSTLNENKQRDCKTEKTKKDDNNHEDLKITSTFSMLKYSEPAKDVSNTSKLKQFPNVHRHLSSFDASGRSKSPKHLTNAVLDLDRFSNSQETGQNENESSKNDMPIFTLDKELNTGQQGGSKKSLKNQVATTSGSQHHLSGNKKDATNGIFSVFKSFTESRTSNKKGNGEPRGKTEDYDKNNERKERKRRDTVDSELDIKRSKRDSLHVIDETGRMSSAVSKSFRSRGADDKKANDNTAKNPSSKLTTKSNVRHTSNKVGMEEFEGILSLAKTLAYAEFDEDPLCNSCKGYKKQISALMAINLLLQTEASTKIKTEKPTQIGTAKKQIEPKASYQSAPNAWYQLKHTVDVSKFNLK